MSASLRIDLLSELQKYIGAGKIINGLASGKILADDLEISLSPLGCFEAYCDSSKLFNIIPYFLNLANSNGQTFHWLFLDSIEISEEANQIRSNLVHYFQTHVEFQSILVGSLN